MDENQIYYESLDSKNNVELTTKKGELKAVKTIIKNLGKSRLKKLGFVFENTFKTLNKGSKVRAQRLINDIDDVNERQGDIEMKPLLKNVLDNAESLLSNPILNENEGV